MLFIEFGKATPPGASAAIAIPEKERNAIDVIKELIRYRIFMLWNVGKVNA